MSSLKLMSFNGWQTIVSAEHGCYPFFSSSIRFRVNHKLYTNVAVTGEAGIGKSYDALDMARICEGLTRSGHDRFKIDQVVYEQSAYLSLLPSLKIGKAIVFDEPSYALGKRDWYKELQKVLVHTLESQRFLVHPVFIPIINLALLDKTIRAYLISHVVHVVGRGHALAYRVKPSQRTEKVYWYQMGELYYRMLDSAQCSRDTCLGCKKVEGCMIFRAQYERKKRSIQIERYEQGKEQAIAKESQDLTEQQLEQMILPVVKDLMGERGRLSIAHMRVFFREHDIHLSHWKAYQIKGNIESCHPELFQDKDSTE